MICYDCCSTLAASWDATYYMVKNVGSEVSDYQNLSPGFKFTICMILTK